jgi:hypothetical protein
MTTSSDAPTAAVPADRATLDAELPPSALVASLVLIARCAVHTAGLLARHRLRLPKDHLGMRIRFGDGSTGKVYRETLASGRAVREPVVLMVEFRLKVLNGPAGQGYFRAVSLLNTPLFAGFTGFRSKLWLAADETDRYRGLYQWDGAELAVRYVRALWWPLALVSDRDSIHYRILDGVWRDDVLNLTAALPESADQWWRVVAVDAAAGPYRDVSSRA